MIRGWILFSTLTLSVIFKLWPDYGTKNHHFMFSDETLNTQSLVYYAMEHIIAIGVAACLLIRDSTPRWLLWLFFAIMGMDFVHFLFFYRDLGVGFNAVKVFIFGIPLIYIEAWRLLKQSKNQA